MERHRLQAIAVELDRMGAGFSGALEQERLVEMVIRQDLSVADLLAVMRLRETATVSPTATTNRQPPCPRR